MKNLIFSAFRSSCLVIFCLFPFYSLANAEEISQDNSANQILELEHLKGQNPAEYDRLIRDRKAEFQESLRKFREEKKGNDTEFLKKHEAKRETRLRELKQNHPQDFKRLMDHRLNRLETARATNPERFQRIMQNHPRLQKRFEEFQNQKANSTPSGLSKEPARTFEARQRKGRNTPATQQREGGDQGFEEGKHQRDFRNGSMVRKGGLPGRKSTVN